jgi:hypothetical protein
MIRLGVLTLLLIAAPFALHLLHQTGTTLGEAGRRRRRCAWCRSIRAPVRRQWVSGFAAAEAFGFAIVALLAIWLTYLGFGSIALWAFRFAWVQFRALGTLMSRAEPLLMITVVVYFTGELSQLAARMTRQRLWQTIGFLAVVAIVFVVTPRDEVRALREDRAEQTSPAKLLTGTPLETEAGHQPRAHAAVACRASQCRCGDGGVAGHPGGVLHRGAVAFFLALDIVAVPDDVAVLWKAEETCPVGEQT